MEEKNGRLSRGSPLLKRRLQRGVNFLSFNIFIFRYSGEYIKLHGIILRIKLRKFLFLLQYFK